jgi:thiamine kinase-like enzyme
VAALSDSELALVKRLLPQLGDIFDCYPADGGLNNRSFVLEFGAERCLLRFRATRNTGLALDPSQEIQVLEAVANAGVGPPLIASDAAAGLLVSAYLGTARAWDAAAARQTGNILRIAGRLRAVHGLAVEVPVFEPLVAVDMYARSLARRGGLGQAALRWVDEYRDIAQWYLRRFEGCTLCHNDLVADNVLDDGLRLWLIDFEYACRSHPVLDLASLAALNSYDDAHRDVLCAAYYDGQRAPFTPDEFRRVVRMQGLLAYFWAAWSCIEAASGTPRRAYRQFWEDQLKQDGK